MNKLALPILLAVLALTSSGCASMFLHGARMVGRGAPTTGATGAWRLAGCVDTAGNPQGGADLTYYLFQTETGLELFERSADGSGAMITNQWADSNGTHFYTWVGSNGWEYVVSGPSVPAVRNVYAGSGSDTTADGSVRPTGSITYICALDPMAP